MRYRGTFHANSANAQTATCSKRRDRHDNEDKDAAVDLGKASRANDDPDEGGGGIGDDEEGKGGVSSSRKEDDEDINDDDRAPTIPEKDDRCCCCCDAWKDAPAPRLRVGCG